ncbi:MAG: hypothetical protein HY663_02300 [Chloroflexi bacterium]|nr:hypothetical protein [Chloroflexota bacterium]
MSAKAVKIIISVLFLFLAVTTFVWNTGSSAAWKGIAFFLLAAGYFWLWRRTKANYIPVLLACLFLAVIVGFSVNSPALKGISYLLLGGGYFLMGIRGRKQAPTKPEA